MTNLEAIRASVMYPVEDAQLNKALFDRDLDPTADYSRANKQAMDYAVADLYVIMVTTPTIAEGGYQISLTDKGSLMKAVSAIYKRYEGAVAGSGGSSGGSSGSGEADPFAATIPTPKVKGSSPW